MLVGTSSAAAEETVTTGLYDLGIEATLGVNVVQALRPAKVKEDKS